MSKLLADRRVTLLIALLSVAACNCSSRPKQSAKPPMVSPSPAADDVATPSGSGIPRAPVRVSTGERWLHLAFAHASLVLVVEVLGPGQHGSVRSRTLQEIRGFKAAAEPPLEGLRGADGGDPAPGSKWIVALDRSHGAAPHGGVLAQLPYTKENLARARSWALPPWRYTPYVMIVDNQNLGPTGYSQPKTAAYVAPEWMFEGTGLPDWQPGSKWLGYVLDARTRQGWGTSRPSVRIGGPGWAKHKLFVEDLFLPGAEHLPIDRALRLSRTAVAMRAR